MAKNKYIISESVVRRFQKLATINSVNEAYGMKHMEEDEHLEEMAHEMEEGAHEMEEAAHEMEEAEMDMPEPEEAPAAEAGAEDMARAVIQAVADALGVEVDIDAGEEEAEMDMEEPVEMDMEEPVEMDAEEEVMQEEETLEEVEVIDEDALTEAVMKRVLSRLKGMTSKTNKE